YPIVVYDGTNMESANANITFNTETGKASFAFTVTDPADYGKDWYISTGMTKANAVIYNVDPLPELTAVSASISGSQLDVTWAGTKTEELDKISFYLTEDTDPAAESGVRYLG